MLFRNLVLSALFIGVIAGTIYGIFQQAFIIPIIHAAETYEVEAPEPAIQDDSHNHSYDGWAPKNRLERTVYTVLSNSLIGIAFALLLLGLMLLHNLRSVRPRLNLIRGIGWGVAMMAALFIAPAMLGMPPEIPGTEAPALADRQIWWVFCVLATAVGFAILYYTRLPWKAGGLILIALPHLAGAPHQSLSFGNTDPAAVTALTALTEKFYLMTAIGSLIFFVLLGALCGHTVSRYIDIRA